MSQRRQRLLLTNDDGISAPGLQRLAEVLAPDYDLVIVAPHRERSGAGHGITILRDLRLERFERGGTHWGWSFQGKPADCVKMGITSICENEPVDFVVSGINLGQNLGVNILYSGTVAAAREGALLGIPSIAFSLTYRDITRPQFATAGHVAREITRRVAQRGLPPGVYLNVNIPDVPWEEIQGYAITRQGDSGFRDHFHPIGGHPDEGGVVYRNIGKIFSPSSKDDHDLDDRVIRKKLVSITPLYVDTTAHHVLNDLQDLAGPRAPTGESV